jgi:quercetin dioxygenase-like cupin family protein
MEETKRQQLSMTFELAEVAHEMRGESAYGREGHTARTLVREADLRIVLLAMQAGSILKEHRVDETASVHTLTGHVRLRFADRFAELPNGRLLTIERGLAHSVEALEESLVLLTLGWRAK